MSQQFPPNQPYQPQQPGSYASPLSPMPPTFTPALPKKPRRWPWIVAIIVALLVGYVAGASGHSSDSATTTTTTTQGAPTQAAVVATHPAAVLVKPTTAPKPKAPSALFSLTGNGELTTKTFTATGPWTLSWTCTPSPDLPEAPLYINVLQGGQDSLTGDVSASCKTGNISGSSEESLTGQISLHIISGIDWTVKAVAE